MSAATKARAVRPAVTIYHNPRCSTSRNVLAAIRAAGIEPEIVEYLKQPPGRARLAQLIEAAGLGVRELVRAKEKLFIELGLDRSDVTEKAILEAIAEHPILMNRPIVVTKKGVRLCRPAERLNEIL
jgi:arsenate reductase